MLCGYKRSDKSITKYKNINLSRTKIYQMENKEKSFSPAVRESLVRSLKSLAYNLWWTWNPDAAALFKELSPLVWEQSNHSAVAVLKRVSDTELRARLGDNHFATRVHTILEEFSTYIHHTETWCVQHAPHLLEKPVAYFSAEFGLHECLPIYSGGLGGFSWRLCKVCERFGNLVRGSKLVLSPRIF